MPILKYKSHPRPACPSADGLVFYDKLLFDTVGAIHESTRKHRYCKGDS